MRVLHLEDDPADRDLTRRTLARMAPDIELVQATDLAEARTLLERPEPFAAALVDLDLPDGCGLELVTEIRQRDLPTAVVVLTGSGDEETVVAALQAGADDYLAKDPATAARLPALLRSACGHIQSLRRRQSRCLHVLYAEHLASDIDLTRRHFARHAPHIRLTVVTSAEEALQLLPADPDTPTDFDVLLLDYRLPGIHALEALRILRERGLDIPVVIVTGHGSETVAAQAIQLGVDDYISKHPGYLHELPTTLDNVRYRWELARERSELRTTSERLDHFLAASPAILYGLRLGDRGARAIWVSANIERLLGYPVEEALAPGWWYEHLHPDDRERAAAISGRLKANGEIVHEYRFFDHAGRIRWIRDEIRLLPHDANSHGEEAIGVWRDISADKQAEQIQETRLAVLDGLVANQPLAELLEQIARRLEAIHPDMRVSILVRDPRDGRLYTGAAPSLPAFYNAAVDGLEVAVGRGSCGTAAATGETVIVEDVRTHPYWAPYAAVTQPAGFRACWSVPFKDSGGQVLGTFGVYYDEPRRPTPAEQELIGEFARIAALAVERVRVETDLRQAAAVFENTREGIMITDLAPRILRVNRAFCEITGYTEAEVLGRDPSLLRSGRQDRAFYQGMWRCLQETGHWQGEVWNRRKSGEVYPQLLTISTVAASDGTPSHYVAVMTDISQLKQSQERLEHLAHYDPLTDLPNRLLLQLRLEHALERARRHQRQVAVLFLDLDHFKVINDSLGHPAGDRLLETLARRLQKRVRDEDTLGRLGGDEFLVIMEDLPHPGAVTGLAQDLIRLLEKPFKLSPDREVYVCASIGISLFPEDGATVTDLIKHADTAMYQAKEEGRGTYRFYTPGLSASASTRLEMEARLRRALSKGEFVLHYQPQVDMTCGAVIGCEALVRWHDPQRGMVSPAQFIPIAEQTGLIVPLGEWVLRTACLTARTWLDAGLPSVVMAVNLSARQLRHPEVIQLVAGVLAETRLPPGQLKLELTESMVMGYGQEAVTLLEGLKSLGVKLALDDFGTGYSSLAYLKRFPIDELKIDQSFVRDIPDDPNDMEIASAIIGMGRALHLRVIAEGVETEAQRDFLLQQECRLCQGYLYGRPVPADELARRWRGSPESPPGCY